MASQKLPILPARKIIKVLKKEGFVEYPVKRGRHRKFKKKVGNEVFVVIVPDNEKKIGKGLLLAIIDQAGYSKESFLDLI